VHLPFNSRRDEGDWPRTQGRCGRQENSRRHAVGEKSPTDFRSGGLAVAGTWRIAECTAAKKYGTAAPERDFADRSEQRHAATATERDCADRSRKRAATTFRRDFADISEWHAAAASEPHGTDNSEKWRTTTAFKREFADRSEQWHATATSK
jgi:hypothetical protein